VARDTDPRIELIKAQIMALAAGDLTTRGELSGEDDDFDAIIAGLNMLAEDFRDREEARLAAEEERSRLTERSEQLEKSNQALTEFAYVASHDLQEPLRMVSSFTQLLAKRYQGKLDADADTYIRFAVDGALRMQALIQALLEYSRVGEHVLSVAIIDVSSVVADALRTLELSLNEVGAKVNVDVLPTLRADARQLARVFQNLIANAVKYRSERPLRLDIDAMHEGSSWHFRITDNGIGFEQRHASLVFGLFQRLHTRAEYAGTGIGLAVCRKIIEAHGGQIWAESQPGIGTSIHFTLPFGPPSTPKASVPA
jgi:light-regulated signal transduction histidine kinase (bacteriophytochrome)